MFNFLGHISNPKWIQVAVMTKIHVVHTPKRLIIISIDGAIKNFIIQIGPALVHVCRGLIPLPMPQSSQPILILCDLQLIVTLV